MARPKKNEEREDQFRELMVSGLDNLGHSLYWLAKQTGAEYSTLKRVVYGRHPCSEPLKISVLNAIQASEQQKFWVRSTSDDYRGLYLPDTGTTILEGNLHRALERLFRAQYPEALSLCALVMDKAMDEDHLDRANAHSCIAWTFFEMGRARQCSEEIKSALTEIRQVFGNATLTTILTSLAGSGASAILSRGERSTAVLQDLLHLIAKFRAERVVHVALGKEAREAEIEQAKKAFANVALIDEWVGDSQKTAHTSRWHAVMLAGTGARSTEDAVTSLLESSRKNFNDDENGPVYLERDMGLAAFFQHRPERARKHLKNAVPLFAKFNDPRGLGPVFYALSKLEAQESANWDLVRQYALAGAVLHPYYFMADRARVLYSSEPDRVLLDDVEQLYRGRGRFALIPSLLERVNRNEERSAEMVINSHLRQIFPMRRVA